MQVVDDVKSNRDLFARMLVRKGVATVVCAEDGNFCVRLFQAYYDRQAGRTETAAVTAVSALPPSQQLHVLPQVVLLDKEMPIMVRSPAYSRPCGSF